MGTRYIGPFSDGLHAICVTAENGGGLTGVSSHGYFVIDTSGDNITGLQAKTSSTGSSIPAGTWQTDNDPYFAWNTPTSTAPIVGYSWSVDAPPTDTVHTTNTYCQYETDDFSDGQHTFYVKAKDAAGNWGNPSSFSVWVDTSGDNITGLQAKTSSTGSSIPAGTWQTDNDPYFAWNTPTSTAPIVGYSWSVDAPPTDTVHTTNTYCQYETDDFSDGQHTFYVKAKDAAGNWGNPSSFSVWGDTVGDNITGLQAKTSSTGSSIPAGTWQTDNDPYFAWNTPTSTAPIVGYSWSVDAPPTDTVHTTNTYCPYETDDFSDGQHTFYVKAKDAAGNWGNPSSFSIWVDASGDIVTGLQARTSSGGSSIPAGTWQTDNDPYFSWNAPSSTAPIVGYSLSLDTPPDNTINVLNAYYQYSADALPNGTRMFYIKAKDAAGNWGDPSSFSIWVDDQVPTDGTISINSGAAFTNSLIVTLDSLVQLTTTAA